MMGMEAIETLIKQLEFNEHDLEGEVSFPKLGKKVLLTIASPILKKGGSFLIYTSIIESYKLRAPHTCWEIAVSDPQATKEIELLHRLRE
jgi:hypothetical protein